MASRERWRWLRPEPVRLLRFGLLAIVVLVTVRSAVLLLFHHPVAVDLEIPLRASDRWVRGEPPYLASAFELRGGPDLPYFYPPALLPVLAPLLELPRWLVSAGWLGLCLAAAIFALNRLAVPPLWWPLFLASPPFLEPLIGGNVQLVMLALFVWLFFAPPTGQGPFALEPRDPTDEQVTGGGAGLAAALIAAIKVSQAHTWAYLLMRRPRAALSGAAIIAILTVLTVPLTGFDLWFDWLAQIRRAADPSWVAAGISLADYVGPAGLVVAGLVSVVLLAAVPRERAGEWVGILTVAGAPSLHVFGVLPLLPALLRVRRELALVAAIFLGTYTEPGMWLAIAIVGLGYTAGARYPVLREPTSA